MAPLPPPEACPVCSSGRTARFQSIADREYWRCTTCLAIFLHPAQHPDPGAEEARYRLHQNDPGDPAYRRFLARLAQPLLARLAPGREGLDYGCGLAPALAEMLREAGHRVRLYDPFFQPDAAALEQTYDFITCTEVVEHFHHPACEFARLDALLRPGAWLAIMTRFQTDDERFENWHYRRDLTHVVFYRGETFQLLAARFGWDCEIPVRDVVLMRQRRGCA